jgi:hypothetical protein
MSPLPWVPTFGSFTKTPKESQTYEDTQTKQRVCHTLALPFILKYSKEELWKLKYFTMQKYNLQKIL